MEKFITTLLLVVGGLTAQAQTLPPTDAVPALPERKLAPRLRPVPSAPSGLSVADDGRRRPQAIVLDAHAGPFAEVKGAADARDAAQLFTVGQSVRLGSALALRGRYLSVYRPGPRLESTARRGELGRLAFRIGSVNLVRSGSSDEVEAVIVKSSREIVAGDLVLDMPQARQGQEEASLVAPGVPARVAAQHGPDRLRLAAARQVVGLDRGAADGVHAGMCLRQAPGCRGRGDFIGRILHAGSQASAAQLAGSAAPLEAGDEVCIAPCLD
jgi:hypothetical protein